MYAPTSITPSLRPWLTVEDGELLLEPVPGISFDVATSRQDLNDHLMALASFGVCQMELTQDESATYFTITTTSGASVVVFDDQSDRIVAVVPLGESPDRLWN
jgi:hypothetical protein